MGITKVREKTRSATDSMRKERRTWNVDIILKMTECTHKTLIQYVKPDTHVPVPVSGRDSKLFPCFKEGDDIDVFLNAFKMRCELNKIGQEDMVWCLAALLSQRT